MYVYVYVYRPGHDAEVAHNSGSMEPRQSPLDKVQDAPHKDDIWLSYNRVPPNLTVHHHFPQ